MDIVDQTPHQVRPQKLTRTSDVHQNNPESSFFSCILCKSTGHVVHEIKNHMGDEHRFARTWGGATGRMNEMLVYGQFADTDYKCAE